MSFVVHEQKDLFTGEAFEQMQSKQYITKFRNREKLITLIMMPFILFRLVILTMSYITGMNEEDMDIPWIIYHGALASVLTFSYGYLITSLKKPFEDEYDEIKRSLLVFFMLEINLYLFYVICHILQAC